MKELELEAPVWTRLVNPVNILDLAKSQKAEHTINKTKKLIIIIITISATISKTKKWNLVFQQRYTPGKTLEKCTRDKPQ